MQDILRELLLVFLSGGAISSAVQILIDLTKLTPARILVLLVSSGVLLYAVGAYEPLYSVFGAGVSVPLLGFGATIAKGVREAVDKQGLLGALTGPLRSTSGGIVAALVFGYLACLIFKGHPKR